MTRSIALKVAVSALAIGVTIAAWPAAQAMRPPSPEKQAADAAAQAQAEAAKGHLAASTRLAEQAVAASPRDVGYRLLLADLYLKGGRFQSAATTYGDVVALDPSNSRAALTLALCDVAQGRKDAAIAILDAVASNAPTVDLGLAYALAGQPQRAIALLEPVARSMDANGRIRQNLAFAYAMAGDWEKARVTAQQDVSPGDLGARLAQWASFAKPANPSDPIAALLRVRPVADGGQPERLALNPAPSDTALAAADPAPAPQAAPEAASPVPVREAAAEPQQAAPISAAPPAPVVTASNETPAWVDAVRNAQDPTPQAEAPARPLYADAVQSLVAAQPAVLRTGHALRARQAGFELPHSATTHGANGGRFAVQLGAFSSADAVERAWGQILRRFGFADATPYSTTISIPGKGVLHRLSVAGFDSRADADRTCRSIRAKGGACFVRAVAGDAPPRWASRYASANRG
jgi:Flp pilus assembly protein TadD